MPRVLPRLFSCSQGQVLAKTLAPRKSHFHVVLPFYQLSLDFCYAGAIMVVALGYFWWGW